MEWKEYGYHEAVMASAIDTYAEAVQFTVTDLIFNFAFVFAVICIVFIIGKFYGRYEERKTNHLVRIILREKLESFLSDSNVQDVKYSTSEDSNEECRDDD